MEAKLYRFPGNGQDQVGGRERAHKQSQISASGPAGIRSEIRLEPRISSLLESIPESLSGLSCSVEGDVRIFHSPLGGKSTDDFRGIDWTCESRCVNVEDTQVHPGRTRQSVHFRNLRQHHSQVVVFQHLDLSCCRKFGNRISCFSRDASIKIGLRNQLFVDKTRSNCIHMATEPK